MMNPDTLALIRRTISESQIPQGRVERLLYSGAAILKNSDDIRQRAQIVEALGYDPEDKWR